MVVLYEFIRFVATLRYSKPYSMGKVTRTLSVFFGATGKVKTNYTKECYASSFFKRLNERSVIDLAVFPLI